MPDIRTQLRTYLENTSEVTLHEIRRLATSTEGRDTGPVHPRPVRGSRWRGPLVAVGTAVVVVAAVAGSILMLRVDSPGVSDNAVTVTTPAVAPPETTLPPPVTTVRSGVDTGGVVTVVVSDLTDAAGNELAGVLMAYDVDSPSSYQWDGVAGFATTVDSDPFATSQVLGDVTDAWAEGPDEGMWPWPSGTATIPSGEYSLQLWTGKDYCCYSRWMPAESPGLRFCELTVSLTGQDQTIYITDIPSHGGPCPTDPATATTGTITISLEGIEGMKGYRLLVGAWSEVPGDLVGGAFWTIIDTDPYSDADFVHTPVFADLDTEIGEVEGWAADDYHWDHTAQLPPGRYQITVWANPGELAPYGSHIPASPIERTCLIDVDVTAGTNTTVTITGIPGDGEGCQLASETSPRQ